ncbi:MAG: hypothetical protein IBX64_08485 [Actinobacteria bacterium]|nr:hypothetical protein [Actinomycetota bacterium]
MMVTGEEYVALFNTKLEELDLQVGDEVVDEWGRIGTIKQDQSGRILVKLIIPDAAGVRFVEPSPSWQKRIRKIPDFHL